MMISLDRVKAAEVAALKKSARLLAAVQYLRDTLQYGVDEDGKQDWEKLCDEWIAAASTSKSRRRRPRKKTKKSRVKQ